MAELRLAALAIALATAVASAAPDGAIQPPAGWHADPGRAADVTAASGKLDGDVAISAYVPAPADAGVALFVTAATRRGTTLDAQVADFHRTIDRDRLTSTTAVDEGASDNRTGNTADSRLATHDPASHLSRDARLLARADGDVVRSVLGECLRRDDADATLVAACKASLDTLAVVTPEASPAAGSAASSPGADGWGAPRPVPQMGPVGDFGHGSGYLMPPVEVPPTDPGIDHRPMLFGAGIAVLAAAFWWNRRNRVRRDDDRDDRDDGRDRRRAGGDDDDELRAAARGDRKDKDKDKDEDEDARCATMPTIPGPRWRASRRRRHRPATSRC